MLARRNSTSQNSFDIIPDELIIQIFKYFSPLQLAGFSLVCSRFRIVANSFPRLSNIQAGFFKENKQILNNQLRVYLENLLKHFTDNDKASCLDKIKKIREVILAGADIHSTNIQFFQPLILYYVICLENISFRNAIIDIPFEKEVRKLIIFLLENKINVNDVYKQTKYPLIYNQTALDYAKKYADQFPRLFALLNEYDQYNKNYQYDESKAIAKLQV